MKNQTLLLLLLSLSATNIVLSSQSDDSQDSQYPAASDYLGTSQTPQNDLFESQHAQVNDGHNYSLSRQPSELTVPPYIARDFTRNAAQNNSNRVIPPHAPTQQEQIQPSQYSLASATQQSQHSQESTVSTLIGSSQGSGADAQLHRCETMLLKRTKEQSQHAQGSEQYSYLRAFSDDEDN